MDTEAKKLLSKAKANLVLTEPFWASLLLRLESIEDPTAPTMWTDGKRVGYNPAFIKSLSFDELKGVLAHEVGHCILLHPMRRGGRDARKFNIATDYAENHIIEEAGFRLPPGRLRGAQYDGKDAETIYAQLPDDGQGGGKSKGQNQASGQVDQGQAGDSDPGRCGEVREANEDTGEPLGRGALKKLEAEWKVATVQAANMAKKQGKLPAGLDRLIQDIIQPKIPVAELLARYIAEITKNDFTWMQPNRRYVSQGIYLPSLYKPEVGEIILLVDTSGSISQADLALVAGCMQNILGIYQKGFTLVYVDADVAGVQEIGPEDDLKLDAKGGGGTDFRPGFEWIEKEGREPKAVIYITDGYCSSFPEVEPPFPVLWLLNMRNDGFKAPWGETLVINWE